MAPVGRSEASQKEPRSQEKEDGKEGLEEEEEDAACSCFTLQWSTTWAKGHLGRGGMLECWDFVAGVAMLGVELDVDVGLQFEIANGGPQLPHVRDWWRGGVTANRALPR